MTIKLTKKNLLQSSSFVLQLTLSITLLITTILKKLMFIEYRWNRSISIPWLFWPWIELLYMYKDLVKKTFTELQGPLLWMFESKLCFCCYKDCFFYGLFFSVTVHSTRAVGICRLCQPTQSGPQEVSQEGIRVHTHGGW